MNEWSPRFETKARRPSGDQVGDPASPRAKKYRLAGVAPSTGADQIARSLTKATRSLFGEMLGSSPSPRSFGSPPANGTVQTCTLICTGPSIGLTPTVLSKFEP